MSVRDEWNMACPDCGNDDQLLIDFVGTARLYPDGTEDCGDHTWDDKSACRCDGCGWSGNVAKAKEVDDAEIGVLDACKIEAGVGGYRFTLTGHKDADPQQYGTYLEAVYAAADALAEADNA